MARHSVNERSRSVPLLEGLAADLRADLPETLALNGMGAYLWDVAAGLIHVDRGGLAILGLAPETYDGSIESFNARIMPDEVPVLRALMDDALAHHETFSTYFRLRPSGSGIVWAHIQGRVQRDSAGVARRVAGVIRDAGAELRQLMDQTVLEANRERQADIVHTTTSGLSQALTVEDVGSVLTEGEVLAPLGAVGVSLTVVQEGRLLRLADNRLPPGMLHDPLFTLPDAPVPIAQVIRTGLPAFLTRQDIQEQYPALWTFIEESALSVGAVLPLVAQGETIGGLAIFFEDKAEFTPEERNLLLSLAATVSQSVQRALLYDDEHAMAAALQQSMLPARIPAVTGVRAAVRYRPARDSRRIGGDWYDVVPLPGARVGLVVGDVEGHDLHASAVMGQLRTALRAYAAEGHPPARVMTQASAFLHDLDTDRFATCVYADLDPATGQARFIRAGHHDPLVRCVDGGSTRLSVGGGLPLGLTEFDTRPYPTTDVMLRPGETLLLCTDGLVEYSGTDLDEGLRKIGGLLSDGPADTEALADHIVGFTETGERQRDDIALLLVMLAAEGAAA